MQKSWIEDFEKKYNKPTVEQITVGFSGIDPNPKCTGGSSEEISQEVLEKLKELEIRIDSGNIDPDAPEPAPSPSPTPTIQIEDDHEKLNNLLGGNSEGHFHVTHDELAKLQNLPERVTDGKAATIKIGTVTTGAEGTRASVTNRGTENAAILDFVIPRGERGIDGATGAKGSKGDPFTYEDFTPAQLAALKGEKGDTGATGAKGEKGDTFNFEDLTEEQLENLKNKIGSGVSDHEELTNLQGGTDNEHYHFTFAENYLTRTLLANFFKLEDETEPEDDDKVYPASFTIDVGDYDPTPYLPYG